MEGQKTDWTPQTTWLFVVSILAVIFAVAAIFFAYLYYHQKNLAESSATAQLAESSQKVSDLEKSKTDLESQVSDFDSKKDKVLAYWDVITYFLNRSIAKGSTAFSATEYAHLEELISKTAKSSDILPFYNSAKKNPTDTIAWAKFINKCNDLIKDSLGS